MSLSVLLITVKQESLLEQPNFKMETLSKFANIGISMINSRNNLHQNNFHYRVEDKRKIKKKESFYLRHMNQVLEYIE